MLERLARDGVEPYVVEEEAGEPVGYLQVWTDEHAAPWLLMEFRG